VQSHFRVETRSETRGVVLAVAGELDLASAPALEDELDKALGGGTSQVVVDLRELEFIDSTGLSVLVKAHQRAQESEQQFGLVKGGAQVQRLLALTGLADRLTVAETPEELLDGG
jgi:anti-sigma B factor antagonist